MSDFANRIQVGIAAQRQSGLKGTHWDNSIVARETMLADLDGWAGIPYNLDTERRDILLAHARQDAAHAVSNTASIIRQLQLLTAAVKGLAICVVALFLTTLLS